MLIRRESPTDFDAVRAVHEAAFDRADLAGESAPEAVLVDELRSDGDLVPGLALVADIGGEVVGHVVCSRATIARRPALGLGPIGVQPHRQRGGVGSALMHAVIAAADALDEPVIVLLGHPAYYPRFGFVPAVEHGITPPQDWGPALFMVRRLTAWAPGLQGLFRYAPAFERL